MSKEETEDAAALGRELLFDDPLQDVLPQMLSEEVEIGLVGSATCR